MSPFPDDTVIVMEVDELWHYLKKSKKFRFLKPMIAIKHDAWTGNVVIGLMPYSKIFDGFITWKILLYCRDDCSSFYTIIPGQRRFQGKEKRVSIAQNYSRQWQGSARFRGKPLAKSRLLEIIDITIRIFPAIHGNITLNFDWISLVKTLKNLCLLSIFVLSRSNFINVFSCANRLIMISMMS